MEDYKEIQETCERCLGCEYNHPDNLHLCRVCEEGKNLSVVSKTLKDPKVMMQIDAILRYRGKFEQYTYEDFQSAVELLVQLKVIEMEEVRSE